MGLGEGAVKAYKWKFKKLYFHCKYGTDTLFVKIWRSVQQLYAKTRFEGTSHNKNVILFVSLFQNVILESWKFGMMLITLV